CARDPVGATSYKSLDVW
nr:immunoglobulin heavy chain junction region [Macaca mulatta]MOW50602.1 immunoglobulin heavy chain junction region [Macaca mulatta]